MFFIKINKTKLEEWKVIKQYTVLETGALIEVFQNAELINIDNTTKQGTEKYLQTVCLLTPFLYLPLPSTFLEIKTQGWHHIRRS